MFWIIIICIIFILYIYHRRYQHEKRQVIRNSRKVNMDEIQPGDIIFFSHDYLYSLNVLGYMVLNLFQYIKTSDMTTHCGIVVMYDNRLCLLQITHQIVYNRLYNRFTNGVPSIVDLYDYLNTYDGYATLYKNNKLNHLNGFLINNAKNTSSITLNPYRWLIDGIFDVEFFKDNTMTCYEFLYKNLKEYTHKECNCHNNIYSSNLKHYIKDLGYTRMGIIANYYTQN